jgi:hypothetical protein
MDGEAEVGVCVFGEGVVCWVGCRVQDKSRRGGVAGVRRRQRHGCSSTQARPPSRYGVRRGFAAGGASAGRDAPPGRLYQEWDSMTKFRDRYRVESARLPGWDYRTAGWYFVTVCTKDRIPFFGRVVDGDVILSRMGEIVTEEWQRTPEVRPHVVLDAWILMPNHLHGIIVIVDTPDPVETTPTPRPRPPSKRPRWPSFRIRAGKRSMPITRSIKMQRGTPAAKPKCESGFPMSSRARRQAKWPTSGNDPALRLAGNRAILFPPLKTTAAPALRARAAWRPGP